MLSHYHSVLWHTKWTENINTYNYSPFVSISSNNVLAYRLISLQSHFFPLRVFLAKFADSPKLSGILWTPFSNYSEIMAAIKEVYRLLMGHVGKNAFV